ncbi:VOC family protein [Micropruina sp.]|uniref:VOC family protein n=1 Tax=Micropruina sp. TaxID=2737536 RepID=UPI0039E29FB2
MAISPRFENSRILVSNMDASLAFYCDTLGLVPVGGFRVKGETPLLEIFLADRENRRCLTLQESPLTPVASGTTGYPPFVITVATAAEHEEAVRGVREAGYEIAVQPLQLGDTACFMPVDPDGYLVEVIYQPGEDDLAWGNVDGEYPIIEVEAMPDGLLGRTLK